jgi:hypothetical protein
MSVDISLATHYALYHDWRASLAFCRALPDISPSQPTLFHVFWREETPRARVFKRTRRFGRKQALPLKAFLATQDLARCTLWLWSDHDLSSNPWVRPLLDHVQLRVYDVGREVRGTPLEDLPRVYTQRDGRVYRDGDLFRALALHNYGGVYADMDTVLLRSLGIFLDQEFTYQWDKFDDLCACALLHLRRGSPFARELLEGCAAIPPGKYNWGRENFKRAFHRGQSISVFPSPFFNTEWQADPGHQPFRRTPNSPEMYDGAFAWHWHNRWDEPIEEGSKFQLLEARIQRRLAELGINLND